MLCILYMKVGFSEKVHMFLFKKELACYKNIWYTGRGFTSLNFYVAYPSC